LRPLLCGEGALSVVAPPPAVRRGGGCFKPPLWAHFLGGGFFPREAPVACCAPRRGALAACAPEGFCGGEENFVFPRLRAGRFLGGQGRLSFKGGLCPLLGSLSRLGVFLRVCRGVARDNSAFPVGAFLGG